MSSQHFEFKLIGKVDSMDGTSANKKFSRTEITEVIARIFSKARVPQHTAHAVINALIASELAGYSSHGILRVPDYIADIAAGRLNPDAIPVVTAVTSNIAMVDGQRAFGTLVTDVLSKTLVSLLDRQALVAVGLRNANHIGRLADVGATVAKKGFITIGFVNYLGHGQKTLPWNGCEPRLSTNPVLFAAPRSDSQPPLVIDFSTSVTSEGRVRTKKIQNETVPPGWLVDADWNDVTEASHLYSEPMQAFLRPLGGDAGHKGFILGLMTEILAGVLTGAGDVGSPATAGNGGFFIGLKPNLFGSLAENFPASLETMLSHVKSAKPRPGTTGVKIPGERSNDSDSKKLQIELEIPASLWQTLMTLVEEN